VPSSYVRGVFSGPCGGERGRAVRISTEQSVLEVLGPGLMVGEGRAGLPKNLDSSGVWPYTSGHTKGLYDHGVGNDSTDRYGR
jgi:hypothetical protein